MFEIGKRQKMAQGTIISNWIKAPQIAAKAKPVGLTILQTDKKK